MRTHDILGWAESLYGVTADQILGRAAARIDLEPVREALQGQNILVTGAGGSIGSELCRQLVPLGPARLVLLDHHENSLYRIVQEIKSAVLPTGPKIIPLLGSVLDHSTLQKTVTSSQPAYIFHSAAFKHVPLLEDQAQAAFINNVVGSLRVMEAARWKKSRLVLISTDKAVDPINIMGQTKRLAEILASLDPDKNTRIVRFGNVTGSSGSALEKFIQQVHDGVRLTLTEPLMTRYFMTIPEAASLVLTAATAAGDGDICTLEMGDPIQIGDLAQRVARAIKPDVSPWPVQIIGLRPGEKLHETLHNQDEVETDSPCPAIRTFRSGPALKEEFHQLMQEFPPACQETILDELLLNHPALLRTL
jgi:FlaA1/EpsC-like NDP-sugar epimerase